MSLATERYDPCPRCGLHAPHVSVECCLAGLRDAIARLQPRPGWRAIGPLVILVRRFNRRSPTKFTTVGRFSTLEAALRDIARSKAYRPDLTPAYLIERVDERASHDRRRYVQRLAA